MNDLPVILAELNWVHYIIILIFALGPLINKFNKPAVEKRLPEAKRRPPRPVASDRADLPKDVGGRDALEAEIEGFLKKAGHKPDTRLPQPGAVPSQPPLVTAPVQVAEPVKAKMVVMSDELETPTVTPAERHRPHRSVGDHVSEQFESQTVSDLGRQIEQADEALEDHHHEVFDRPLGRLKKNPLKQSGHLLDNVQQGTDSSVWDSTVSQREKKQTAIENRSREIFALLRSPRGMRQAVILNEILKRPMI